MSTLMDFASNIANGHTKVVDLTHTLDPDFPVIILPPEFGQCARFRMEEISCYDHRGPAWKWHNISMSEHTGTHFDAPAHWISGRDLPNASVDEIDVKNFIGPICVIDCSDGANQKSSQIGKPFMEQFPPILGFSCARTGPKERAWNI
jgi:kynurenine formamidase